MIRQQSLWDRDAGIMPIMTYGGFKRMTGFCKTKIPDELAADLEAIKDNDEAVKVRGSLQGRAWGRAGCFGKQL